MAAELTVLENINSLAKINTIGLQVQAFSVHTETTTCHSDDGAARAAHDWVDCEQCWRGVDRVSDLRAFWVTHISEHLDVCGRDTINVHEVEGSTRGILSNKGLLVSINDKLRAGIETST